MYSSSSSKKCPPTKIEITTYDYNNFLKKNYFFTKFDVGGKRKLEKIRILDLYILNHNAFVV
jgi:hypothetical protein